MPLFYQHGQGQLQYHHSVGRWRILDTPTIVHFRVYAPQRSAGSFGITTSIEVTTVSVPVSHRRVFQYYLHMNVPDASGPLAESIWTPPSILRPNQYSSRARGRDDSTRFTQTSSSNVQRQALHSGSGLWATLIGLFTVDTFGPFWAHFQYHFLIIFDYLAEKST